MTSYGIIGGVGPQATAFFYEQCVVKATARLGYRPNIVLYSMLTETDYEEEYILGRVRVLDSYARIVKDAFDKVKELGVSAVAFPCISLQSLAVTISTSMQIPLISPLDQLPETVNKCKGNPIGLVAATNYQGICQLLHNSTDEPIERFLMPSEDSQKFVSEAALAIIKGRPPGDFRSILKGVVDELQDRGARYTIIACTELSLIPISHCNLVIDLLDHLIHNTITWIVATQVSED